MKKVFFVALAVFVLCFAPMAYASPITFTDPNFESAVLEILNDGGGTATQVDTTDVDDWIALSIPNKGITDLTEITNFPLLETLDISGNKLKGTVNLSALTALTALDVSGNYFTEADPDDAITLDATVQLSANWDQAGGFIYTPQRSAVTAVTVTPSTLSLKVGETNTTLAATVTPPTATDNSVTWSSSDTSKATVAVNGATVTVTAVAVGTANITATPADGMSGTPGTSAVTVTAAVEVEDSGGSAYNTSPVAVAGVTATVGDMEIPLPQGTTISGGTITLLEEVTATKAGGTTVTLPVNTEIDIDSGLIETTADTTITNTTAGTKIVLTGGGEIQPSPTAGGNIVFEVGTNGAVVTFKDGSKANVAAGKTITMKADGTVDTPKPGIPGGSGGGGCNSAGAAGMFAVVPMLLGMKKGKKR